MAWAPNLEDSPGGVKQPLTGGAAKSPRAALRQRWL